MMHDKLHENVFFLPISWNILLNIKTNVLKFTSKIITMPFVCFWQLIWRRFIRIFCEIGSYKVV